MENKSDLLNLNQNTVQTVCAKFSVTLQGTQLKVVFLFAPKLSLGGRHSMTKKLKGPSKPAAVEKPLMPQVVPRKSERNE